MLKRLLFLLAVAFLLRAEEDPYFGGTLLSTVPVNIPPGTWLVEPYFFWTRQTGQYTSHWSTSPSPQFTSVEMLWEFETGITQWLDIGLFPTFFYTHSTDLSRYRLGDTKLAIGFQALRQKENGVDLRFILQENFPTGKYDRLHNISQVTGSGAYQTSFSAVIHRIMTPWTMNLTLNYIFPAKVHVHGRSLYGGNLGTHSTYRIGTQFNANLGIEYCLTHYTILGLDLHYTHQNRISQQVPSTEQFSVAPCIEYNPSPTFGVEIGPWFTVAGRNAAMFVSGVFTVYWEF